MTTNDEQQMETTTLGKFLEDRRNELQLTRLQVAERTGITRGYVYRIEKRGCAPTILVCAQLSAVLGVPVQTMADLAMQNKNEYRSPAPDNTGKWKKRKSS
jgi:transcriptional regulator with XRE-family HTH domain